METKTALVVTSIFKVNPVLKSLAEGAVKHGIAFIIAGDRKSPPDFKLNGAQFLSIDDQINSEFSLSKLIPENHYTRKNFAYLYAIAQKAKVIIETDDDNFPTDQFWETRVKAKKTDLFENTGWLNIYRFFSDQRIWPRGFPLDQVKTPQSNLKDANHQNYLFPIQQGLANNNPDVDAVYRLLMDLPVKFEPEKEIGLGKNSWCPFNSQNTTWFAEAFPLLYLPSYCSFRMTDIWRSFIAQRIGWEYNWGILFHSPTVYQKRNEHNLMKDFHDEVPGYENNNRIKLILENIELESDIFDNLYLCYEALIRESIIGSEELNLVKAWHRDLMSIEFLQE